MNPCIFRKKYEREFWVAVLVGLQNMAASAITPSWTAEQVSELHDLLPAVADRYLEAFRERAKMFADMTEYN